jgi:hypothetical protein
MKLSDLSSSLLLSSLVVPALLLSGCGSDDSSDSTSLTGIDSSGVTGSASESGDASGTESATMDGSGSTDGGDGDGSTGDGDGSTGDGDGSTGDGDGSTGDGDGDGSTGDGDGSTGDGDGSTGDGSTGDGDGDGSTGDGSTGDGDGDGPNSPECIAAAQTFTSEGCIFAPIVANDAKTLPWAVIAANPGNQSADVTLYDPSGNALQTVVVPAQQLHVFEIDGATANLWEHPDATGIQQLALKLESNRPIVAYEFQPYSVSANATADASLLLPAHAWDINNMAVVSKTDGDAWVTVVSLVDNNDVTVYAADYQAGSSQAGGGIPALSANMNTTVTLNAQETLRIFSPGADLTGMEVLSDEPVALYAGSTGLSLPGPGFQGYHDYLEEQVPPRSSWGTEHAVIKFQPRGNDVDVYRIIADKDGTTVTLSGDYTDSFDLDQGEFAEFNTNQSFLASGNEAFLIAHHLSSCTNQSGTKDNTLYPGNYEATNNCGTSQNYSDMGDPALSYIVPSDQFRQRYTFLTPETYAWDMVTVVAESADWGTITLDGAALPAPTALNGSTLSYARFLIEDGPHYAESATADFGLEVYGYDCRISYAYAGGLSLGTINTPPLPE